jgi:hypothetical protein
LEFGKSIYAFGSTPVDDVHQNKKPLSAPRRTNAKPRPRAAAGILIRVIGGDQSQTFTVRRR